MKKKYKITSCNLDLKTIAKLEKLMKAENIFSYSEAIRRVINEYKIKKVLRD